MIIIVEGPDGAGKSTLIQQLLASHPGSTMVHFGRPKNDEEAFNYWQVYMDAIADSDPAKLTIFDRCWYSDMVYGPVMRNRIEISLRQVKLLEAFVITHGGGHVVYLTAPVRTLWKRCTTRGETFIKNIDQLSAIRQSYENIFKDACTLPVVRYDTSM